MLERHDLIVWQMYFFKVLSQSADLRVGVFETHDLVGVCEALCVGGTVGESVLVRHDPIVWQMYCV